MVTRWNSAFDPSPAPQHHSLLEVEDPLVLERLAPPVSETRWPSTPIGPGVT
jgi:hypothetical protein